MNLTTKQISRFQKEIYDYYHVWKRPFSWRNTTNPYHIFVSEVMLQQTQTTRVVPKYEAFIAQFPDFESLACASQHNLLAAWQGLGYNRRALSLQKSAQLVGEKYGGVLPREPEELITLPGIGKATAASVAAFSFNTPTVFVETNIRVVFFHFFFQKRDSVDDSELLPLVAQTLDTANPREWYYALMDYGVSLKRQGINPIAKSKQYHKQSKFAGSDRQIRGAIVRLLVKKKHLTRDEVVAGMKAELGTEPIRTEKIVAQLIAEKFLQEKNGFFALFS